MNRILIVLAFLFSVSASYAQQVPNHAVPIGRGAGVTGYGSAGPCNSGIAITGTGTSTDPNCGQIDLGAGVSGNLGVNHLNSGTGASAQTFWNGAGVWSSINAATTPEQFGAVGDNVTDDTAAFTNLCNAISAGSVHWVSMNPVHTYKIWSTAPVTQSVLCNMGGATGVRWDFNGAQFNVAYTAQRAVLSGSVSSTTLTVTGISGTIQVGDEIDAGPNTNTVALPTLITAFGSGTGGLGTYTVSRAQTVSPTTLFDRMPAITYIFEAVGAQGIEINDLAGTSIVGKRVSGSVAGVNWVTCSNQGGSGFGCKQLDVRRANVNGGLNGIAITRALGTGSYSQNIHVTGYFANIGYPVSNQADGLNTSFDIVTNNPGRSYIGYNVAGIDGRINATNEPSLNDVEIAAYGFQGDISNSTTSNVSIEYINRQSTLYGASQLAISHQQGDPVHASIATIISNVIFNVDIIYTGTPSTELLQENSFTGLGPSQAPGDPGNTDNNIVIKGKIEGEINATYIGCIQTASNGNCSGFNGTSTGTYRLTDLQIPNSAKPWAIGTSVTNTFGPNYAQPNAVAPTYDAGANATLSSFVQPVTFITVPNFNGQLSIWDPNNASGGVRFLKGMRADFFTTGGVDTGVITAGGTSFFLTTVTATSICLGYNTLATTSLCLSSAIELQPTTDNVFALGDATHRYSNIFGTIGTLNSLVLSGSTAHQILLGQAASSVNSVPSGTAGQLLTSNGAGADPTFQSHVHYVFGNSPTLTQNTTNFCGIAYCSGGSTATSFVFPAGGTYKNLVVYSGTAPAAGQTYIVTIYEGGLTALTCTISNPATTCSDTTHTATHTANAATFFQAVLSATAGNQAFSFSVELDSP